MIVICAWCQKSMGEREPLEEKVITHGICPKCFDIEVKDFETQTGHQPKIPVKYDFTETAHV